MATRTERRVPEFCWIKYRDWTNAASLQLGAGSGRACRWRDYWERQKSLSSEAYPAPRASARRKTRANVELVASVVLSHWC